MSLLKLKIFNKINYYLRLSKKFKALLSDNPTISEELQKEFNSSVDEVYGDVLQFERENLTDKQRINKLKEVFIKRYRRYFLYGEFIVWSFNKPFGYAGDFKIIDAIYQNAPTTVGFDRLWDNYFQRLAISKATRERKNDFKKLLADFVSRNNKSEIRIMNLASGPAREIKELMEEGNYIDASLVKFDCCDFDNKAIDYARELLGNAPNVNFLKKNAVRLALKSDIRKELPNNYDIIYSTGLFDYLDYKIAVRLIKNLKVLLKPNGRLIIASVRDRYSNPSVCWMEWVADWNLIYRDESEFKKIFVDAGFSLSGLDLILQKSGVMQYCVALNNKD